MTFDQNHKPNHANETIAAVFYRRRAEGLNIQVMANGKLDEWSFANAERRDATVAGLAKRGMEYAVSA